MAKNKKHNWQPKGAYIQTCSKCGTEKWNCGKPIYHLAHGRYGKYKYEIKGVLKEPPCNTYGQQSDE